MNVLMFAAAVTMTNTVAVLPQVIVEASRIEAPRHAIPSHVDVIDREAIDSSGAASTVELLEKRANLFVRKVNANPAQARVAMRGYGANGFGRVTVLVDGEELNNVDMSPQELIRVPLASVRNVEVMHGPQTVLHGGNASAGVINITSDDDIDGCKVEVEGRGGSYGTAGAHVGVHGGETLKEDNDDAPKADAGLGKILYYADLDYDRTDGWRDNSWYEIWSLKGGIKHLFDNGSWWSLRTFYGNTRYGLPGGIFMEGSGSWQDRAERADDAYSHSRNDVYGMNLSSKLVLADEHHLTSEFSFRERKSESYYYLKYDVFTFGYKLKYTWDKECNRLDVGTDLKYDLVDVNGYDARTGSGGDNDFQRFCGGVFARDEVKFGDHWSIFGGTRGEWWWNKDVFNSPTVFSMNSSSTRGEAAGEVGALWRPTDEMKVFAKWSRFYHAPLADEMFSSYGVPNLGLKPESGHDFEFGFDWTFLREVNFNFTGYHAELEDEIFYMNYANRNAEDDTARTGFETSLVWSRKNVASAGIMYSYTYSRFTEGDNRGNDVPLVPRQTCRVFGNYYVVDWLSVGGGMRFVGEQRYGGDFAADGGWIPSFVIFDVGLRLMPTSGWLKGLILSATVDNLFDKRYFDYGEYFGSHYIYPAACRSFLVTVRYEF